MPAEKERARRLRSSLQALILAHGALDEARRPCGTPLSIPHAWALMALAERGPLTIKELSCLLQIDRTNVSRLCQRMEEASELERREHPEDGRAKLVALTEKGGALAARVEGASADHFEGVLTRLDVSFHDVMTALKALTVALHQDKTSP